MLNRLLSKQNFMVLLAGLGLVLTLAQFPAYGQVDLEGLDDDQLNAALDAEINDDDLWQCGQDPAKPASVERMVEVLLCVLSDANDDGPGEGVITWAELQEEAEEAHTSLEAVVRQALERADYEDARQPFPPPAFAKVDYSTDLPLPGFSGLDLGPIALPKEGVITPARASEQPLKDGVRSMIRCCR